MDLQLTYPIGRALLGFPLDLILDFRSLVSRMLSMLILTEKNHGPHDTSCQCR